MLENGTQRAEPVAPDTYGCLWIDLHNLTVPRLTPVYGLAEASLAVTFSDPSSTFTSHQSIETNLPKDRTTIKTHKVLNSQV